MSKDGKTLGGLIEIIEGFSEHGGLYIKHCSLKEDLLFQNYYEEQLKKLSDVPSEEEQLKMLISEGIWSQKQEDELNVTKFRIEGIKETLPNILIESQRGPIQRQLDKLELRFFELAIDKREYMGTTREMIANDSSIEYLMYVTVFRDKDLSIKVFEDPDKSSEDVEDLSFKKIEQLKDKVLECKFLAQDVKCRKIACCSYAQAMASVTPEGEEYLVVGRPIHKFTTAQLTFVQYLSVFRTIMQKYNIPEEAEGDPDKILEIPKKEKKLQEIRDKTSGSQDLGSGKSFVGASHSEMRQMGMQGQDLFDVLAKSGKDSLGKEDLI
tara:strand:+ start:41591 stop:42562 length:972 start_codon:yes stop_codon:yes gene_type:complete